MSITIITNNVPRDLINAWELTEAEQKEFDYLDWDALREGRDSATFFRYKGELYDLGTFQRGGLPGWDGSMADSFFSGILVRHPFMFPEWPEKGIDPERIIVGRFYQ